jgi:hypothetical protein
MVAFLYKCFKEIQKPSAFITTYSFETATFFFKTEDDLDKEHFLLISSLSVFVICFYDVDVVDGEPKSSLRTKSRSQATTVEIIKIIGALPRHST